MASETQSRQEEYIARLDELYSRVGTWIENTEMSVSLGTTELNEEAPGRYKAPALTILDSQGKPLAELQPVGAWIIGAEGRVDLVGLLDRNSLIYLTTGGSQITAETQISDGNSKGSSQPLFKGVEQPDWYWIGESRLGRVHPVTQELFLDLLSEVSDYAL